MTTKIEISGENVQISDGYHTFDELYQHRFALYLALCKVISQTTGIGTVFRAKTHSNGTSYEGWFLLGMFQTAGKQISYHLPLEWWESANFAETLEVAPAFDGHTSRDVIERVKLLAALGYAY